MIAGVSALINILSLDTTDSLQRHLGVVKSDHNIYVVFFIFFILNKSDYDVILTRFVEVPFLV